MKALLDKMDGNKTYAGVVLLGLLAAADALGWIPQVTVPLEGAEPMDLATLLYAIVGTWTGVSVRHAIGKR